MKPLSIVLFMAWVTLICGAIHSGQYGYTAYVTHGAISVLKLQGKDQGKIRQLLKAYYRSVGEGAAVVFRQACIIVYARKLRGVTNR